MNTENVPTDPRSKKTNLKPKNSFIKAGFETEIKEEIGKLEAQMKIGWTTITKIAEKLRAKRYSTNEELKKLKFSKEIIELR